MTSFLAIAAAYLDLFGLITFLRTGLADVAHFCEKSARWIRFGPEQTHTSAVAAFWDHSVTHKASIGETFQILLGRAWPATCKLWTIWLARKVKGDDICAVDLALQVNDSVCVGNGLLLRQDQHGRWLYGLGTDLGNQIDIALSFT